MMSCGGGSFTPDGVYDSLCDRVEANDGSEEVLSTGVPPPGIGGFSNYRNVSWVSVAKLAEETAKTSSDVIGNGMMSCAVMAYADEMWRAMPSSLARPAECGMLV